jgi:hypothetical protein
MLLKELMAKVRKQLGQTKLNTTSEVEIIVSTKDFNLKENGHNIIDLCSNKASETDLLKAYTSFKPAFNQSSGLKINREGVFIIKMSTKYLEVWEYNINSKYSTQLQTMVRAFVSSINNSSSQKKLEVIQRCALPFLLPSSLLPEVPKHSWWAKFILHLQDSHKKLSSIQKMEAEQIKQI